VDFLRSPNRYTRLGGRVPRGVLLTGPPGTGTTLLARAVGGEAHAAFFSVSGSEFVEAVVGVGAARVRDLFKQPKDAAPSIIFIDELDANRSLPSQLGGPQRRQRRARADAEPGPDEIGGSGPNVSVAVLSATNRPEILDPALLRPRVLRSPRRRAPDG
jgi:cell division protease FtsH